MPPPDPIPPELLSFVRLVGESLEWGWGQAVFSDAMRKWLEYTIKPDSAKDIGSRWLPRFSIELQGRRLTLRMLTWADRPFHAVPDQAQKAQRCEALLHELWSRVNERRGSMWEQAGDSDLPPG